MATEVISTIRSSGGDYTSLSAWEAGEQADLVTADEISVAECYHDWPGGLEDNVTIAGWTTDSTRYPKITVPSSDRHTGVLKSGANYTGFTILGASYNVSCVVLQQDYAVCEYVAAEQTSGGSLGHVFYQLNENSRIHGCIGTTSNSIVFYQLGWVTSSIAHDAGTVGFFAGGNAAKVSNCSAIGCATGFEGQNNRSVEFENCLGSGNTIADFTLNNSNTAIYCASSDASADDKGGAGNRINQTFTFSDAASDDYHLAAADAGAKGYGTNLYTDFTHDIDGDEWPAAGAWDIGADYYAGGGGGDPDPFFQNQMHPIKDGLRPLSAAGLNGVIVT